MKLITDAVDRHTTSNRTLQPVVNEGALIRDRRVVVVVAQLYFFAWDSQSVQSLASIDKCIVHVLRITRIVIRIGGDDVPLAPTESIGLRFINCLVNHVPDVN